MFRYYKQNFRHLSMGILQTCANNEGIFDSFIGDCIRCNWLEELNNNIQKKLKYQDNFIPMTKFDDLVIEDMSVYSYVTCTGLNRIIIFEFTNPTRYWIFTNKKIPNWYKCDNNDNRILDDLVWRDDKYTFNENLVR